MYTQPDDKINDTLVAKLNKLNKTNDNEELSLTPVLLLHSQFGHAARARVLSAFFGREPGNHCAVDVTEEFLGSAVFFVFGFRVL